MNKHDQIKKWSRLYGRQITEEEYRQVCDNLGSFFDILHKWDKAEKEKQQPTICKS
jgi:hypothetical protein